MKKIFTLFAATFLAAAVFAADPRPNITLTATNGVEVVIDGQSYFNNCDFYVSNRRGEQHSIQVYASRNGYSPYRNSRSSRNNDGLLGSASFRTNGQHLHISVGDYGEILIETDREYAMRTGGYTDRNNGHSQKNDDYRNQRNDDYRNQRNDDYRNQRNDDYRNQRNDDYRNQRNDDYRNSRDSRDQDYDRNDRARTSKKNRF